MLNKLPAIIKKQGILGAKNKAEHFIISNHLL